jgi:hypothetical protein
MREGLAVVTGASRVALCVDDKIADSCRTPAKVIVEGKSDLQAASRECNRRRRQHDVEPRWVSHSPTMRIADARRNDTKS